MSRCLTNLLLLWTTPSWESTGHEATSSMGVTNPLQMQCTGTSEPADAMHVPSKSETSSRAASHVQSMLKTSLRAHSKQDTCGTCWVYSAWADNQCSTHVKSHTAWALQIHSSQSTHKSLLGKSWLEWWHPEPNKFVQAPLKCMRNQVTLKFFTRLDHLTIKTWISCKI